MWLDLVNSQHWDGFGKLTDHLRNPSWVRQFLGYWTVHPRGGLPSTFSELGHLRSTLRQMAERIAAGHRASIREVRKLNAILKEPGYQQIVREGDKLRLELTPVRSDWAWLRSRIAESFGELVIRDQDNRIKICPDPGCRWVFFDLTRGNTRRWCNDRRCGNRDRVRRARARRR